MKKLFCFIGVMMLWIASAFAQIVIKMNSEDVWIDVNVPQYSDMPALNDSLWTITSECAKEINDYIEYKKADEDWNFGTPMLELRTTESRCSHYLSVNLIGYISDGSAAGFPFVINYICDVKKQQFLTIEDVFDTAYVDKVNELIIKHCSEEFLTCVKENSPQAYQVEDICLPCAACRLDKKGCFFLFRLGNCSWRGCGEEEVFISYDELKNYLKINYLE